MRSDRAKKGLERVPHRALLYGTGITKKGMGKPFIGIANSYTNLVPGHVDMRPLAEAITNGIFAGGGQAFTFGIPSICDGIAMGHKGMHYSLPSRELIADCVESMAQAHALDGLVLLTACDKITPGMLMAAGRLDIPSIVVTAGPMLSGRCAGTCSTSCPFEIQKRDRRLVLQAPMLVQTRSLLATRTIAQFCQCVKCGGCGSEPIRVSLFQGLGRMIAHG